MSKSEMKKFIVIVERSYTGHDYTKVTIQANDEDEAEKSALKKVEGLDDSVWYDKDLSISSIDIDDVQEE